MSDTGPHSLRAMIDEWTHTTEQVERGYTLSFYDYLNDLDLRRVIDERLRDIDDARDDTTSESMSIALAVADQRFRHATIVAAENVWGADNEREAGWNAEREWYYYRMPKQLPDSW